MFAVVTMSRTVQERVLQMPVTPSDTINDALQRNFSPQVLAKSPLRKIVAVLIVAFFKFADSFHYLVTREYLPNQSDRRILLLWVMSTLFASVQLALMCRLIFVIAPGIPLLCELVTWIFSGFGVIFSFLIGTIFYFSLVLFALVIFAAGFSYGVLLADNFHVNAQTSARLTKIWICVGVIAVVAIICAVGEGILFELLTTVIRWFNFAVGFVLRVVLQLVAICVGIGGIVLGASSMLAVRQQSGISRRLWFQHCQTARGSLYSTSAQCTILRIITSMQIAELFVLVSTENMTL